MRFLFITELTSDDICEPAQSGADLAFRDRGFKFEKGGSIC